MHVFKFIVASAPKDNKYLYRIFCYACDLWENRGIMVLSGGTFDGIESAAILFGGGPGTEHLRGGPVPAPHPAHPLPAAPGAGGGAGQAADGPGQPEDHPHRGGNAAAQAGGGDPGAGGPDGAGGHAARRRRQRRPLHRHWRDGRRAADRTGCEGASDPLCRHPVPHRQRRRGGCV